MLHQTDERLAAAVEADYRSAHGRLSTWLARANVSEALFVASTSASIGAETIASGDFSAVRGARLGRYYRYAGRFIGRPTPFGTSCGYALVSYGPKTCLNLEPTAIRRTRLDSNYLCSVWETIAWASRSKFHYRVNPTLYKACDRYSLITAHPNIESGATEYSSVALERSLALDQVIELAKRSPRSYEELVAGATGSVPGVSAAVSQGFIDELIRGQVIQYVEAPSAIGVTLDEQLESALCTIQSSTCVELSNLLGEVKSEFSRWDLLQQPRPKADYVSVRNRLTAAVPSADPQLVFHVDTQLRMFSNQVDRGIIAKLTDAAVAMATLASPSWSAELVRFQERFEKRYGQRTVPLLTIFDPEEGIGFQRQDRDAMPPQYSRLFARHRLNGNEIILTNEDIAIVGQRSEQLVPDVFSIHASLLAPGAAGDPIAILHGIRGGSCAWAAARFCHDDAQLRELVKAHMQAEEKLRPNVVFVDVAHFHSARAGNFSVRPRLRYHWVRLFSGGSADQELPLDDLQVFVRNRVHLWSKQLCREVVPRQSCAADLFVGHELFAFLGAIEAAGMVSRAVFDLGPFSPRVRFGDIVLQPASWSMNQAEARRILEQTPCSRFRGVQTYRHLYGVPRWVRLGTGDETILVDLEHPLGCDEMLRLLSTRASTRVFEAIEQHGQGILRGPYGVHVHDLIIPIVRNAPRDQNDNVAPPPEARHSSAHRFIPGHEWLATHIYCAPHIAERILTDGLLPLVASVRTAGHLRRWFFIRYSDPDFHLRVRFLLSCDSAYIEMLHKLNAILTPYVESGALWRMSIDTYDREIERYGGLDSIEPIEELFEIDSDFVALTVNGFMNQEDRRSRWNAALLGLHHIVSAFGVSASARMELLKRCRAAWAPRGTANIDIEDSLRKNFQQQRENIAKLLVDSTNAGIDPDLYVRRFHKMQLVAYKLLRLQTASAVENTIESLLHMHINRFLAPDNDSEEFRLYDMLHRIYRFELGRIAAGQQPILPGSS